MLYNSYMNWFEWSFGDTGWTVPFWFLPLVFFWVWKNNSQRKTEELASKIRDEGSEDYMSGVDNKVESSGVSEGVSSFEDKCEILGKVWLSYRDDAAFIDFIAYNDLGLPLAYAYSNGHVVLNETGRGFIEEAWSLLLSGYDLEDTGFESMDDILEAVDGAVFNHSGESYEDTVIDEDGNVVDDEAEAASVMDAAAKGEFDAPPSGKKF